MEVEERVRGLVLPLLKDLSVDLWDVKWRGSNLRILVDTPQGIDTETLGLVSRTLSRELDKSEAVSGSYTLEVSSPGIERVLTSVQHFESSVGKTLSVKLLESMSPEQDIRRISGHLAEVLPNGILLEQSDGSVTEINYAQIVKAKTLMEMEREAHNG